MNTLLLHSILIAWFLAYFEPLTNFTREKVVRNIPHKYHYLRTSLTCFKCLSFWSCLLLGAMMGGFYIYEAIACAMIAYTYERVINSFKTYL